jgi:DNA-binding NarL/FixJ family response regulator
MTTAKRTTTMQELAVQESLTRAQGASLLAVRPLRSRNPYDLTRPQQDVLYLLSHGLYDHQIAIVLGSSLDEVQGDLTAIRAKMHAASATEAAIKAIREHLFEGPGDTRKRRPA